MGRLGVAGVFIAAAVLCGTPAIAQSMNPTSSQNVVPAATGGGIEARRTALFAQMMRDPANLDVAFEYAALSSQAGDLEAAISTLERMLVFAPGLPRLQFELGVLYYRLAAYQPATAYFEAVLAAPDVPADVRDQATSYLKAIETGSAGSQFAARISTGVTYQTNANAGPGTPNITLNGFNFTLNPGATAQPDINAFASVSATGSFDLGTQGDTFDFTFNGFGSIYRTLGTLNSAAFDLRAGPVLSLARFSIDNANAGLYGIAGGVFLGGAPYLGKAGVGTKLEVDLDARTQLALRYEAAYEAFVDSAQRPTASHRSGFHFSAALDARHQLSPDLGVVGTLRLDRRNAQRNYLSSWQVGAELGALYAFASPLPMLDDPWSINVSAGIQHLIADAPDPVFSATDPERTTEVFVRSTLTVPLPENFALAANAGYTRSFSNYPFGVWDNVVLSTSLSKAF
jgi:tetratricopeptide (TPR) repeat protein